MPLSLGLFGQPRIDSAPKEKPGMKACKKCHIKSFSVMKGKKCPSCGFKEKK
jgi:ribosomal protein L37E